jgi:hypothetical protein
MTSTEKPAACRAAEGSPTLNHAAAGVPNNHQLPEHRRPEEQRPLPLPNAPCSLARSCRIGWMDPHDAAVDAELDGVGDDADLGRCRISGIPGPSGVAVPGGPLTRF